MTSSHEGMGDFPSISYFDDLIPATKLERSEIILRIAEIEDITKKILREILTTGELFTKDFQIHNLNMSEEEIYDAWILKKDEYNRTTKKLLIQQDDLDKNITIEEITFGNKGYIQESYNILVNDADVQLADFGIQMHDIHLVGGNDLVSDTDFIPLSIDSVSAFDSTGKRWPDSMKDYYNATASDYSGMVEMLERFIK